MKLFPLVLSLTSAEFLEKEKAYDFLTRNRRANSWHGAEEFSGGNFERECIEEVSFLLKLILSRFEIFASSSLST